MAHLSDLSWEKSGEEALADFKKGQTVKAKVLNVDVERERISLGIKQLTENPLGAGTGGLKKGNIVTCAITAVVDNGIEVLINDSVPGFIRKGDLSRDRSEQRPDRFAAGEKIDAKITQIDKSGRKLTLSIKAREVEEEKKAMAAYGSSDAGASLGNILGAAFKKKAGKNDDKAAKPKAKPEAKKTKKAETKKDDKANDKKGDDKKADTKEDNKADKKAAAKPAKKAPAKAAAGKKDVGDKKETKKKAAPKAKKPEK